METFLILVTLLAAVSARNVMNADYVPTKEELEMIFGADTHIPEETTTVETLVLVPNESDTIEENIRLCEKINEIFDGVTPASVELNMKINVNDNDKGGAHQNVTQNPVDGEPELHTRFVENETLTDDRVALGVKNCPSDQVRIGFNCVKKD